MNRRIGLWLAVGVLVLWGLAFAGGGLVARPGALHAAPVEPGGVCESTFQDVSPGDPDGPYITCVTAQCVLRGYTCGGPGEPCVPPNNYGYFRPTTPFPSARRAVAVVLSLAAGYTDPIASDQQTFADVPPSDPDWLAIERIYLHAVMNAYLCGGPGEPCDPANRPYFRPDAALPRAGFAVSIAWAAGFSDPPPATATFVDVPVGSAYFAAVERVVARGVMDGYPCGGQGEPCPGRYFRPLVDLNLTRAAMARALARAFLPGCVGPSPTPTLTAPPSKTPTPTPTGTPPTPLPSPVICYSYPITVGSGAIVPGTTRVDGAGCDDCTVDVVLPFPYRLYEGPGQAGAAPNGYPIMRLSADGKGTFLGGGGPAAPAAPEDNTCLPVPSDTYTIYAQWDDLRTTCACCGIFTGVSGAAPNRVFNVEWRAEYYAGGGTTDFELRLYEGQTRFDVIYGRVDQGGSGATVGVQRDAAHYSEYTCNVPGSLTAGLALQFNRALCGAPTPTATATVTGTPPTLTAIPTPVPFCPSSPPCTVQFQDVDSGNPFYTYIRCLACRGVVSGYSCGGVGEPCVPPANNPYFRPAATLTRGQLSKVVANSSGNFDPVASNQQTFSDVPGSHPFWVFIERLAGRGIISGYADGTFRPGDTITRAQAAKIDANAALYTDSFPSAQQTFEDVPPSHPFWLYIERVNAHGVVSGVGCGGVGEPCVPPLNRPYFRPSASVTRGQTTKIVANTFYPGCQTPLQP